MHNLGKFKHSNPMQPKSIEILCNNIKKLSNSAIQQSVDDVVTKFTTVLKFFSKCHHGYNSSKFMDDEEIKQLGKNTEHANKNCTKTGIYLCLQSKTSTFSWPSTELRFLRQQSCLKCTFWKTTWYLGSGDGTLDLGSWGSRVPNPYTLTS